MTTETQRRAQAIARNIGYYFLEKNNNDYEACYRELDSLKIHGYEISSETPEAIFFVILLERPGLLIGYHGKDIENLQNFLSDKFKKKIIIRIKEEKEVSCLYPRNYQEEDYDDFGFYFDKDDFDF